MVENQNFFSFYAAQHSRALIWNNKFSQITQRIQGCALQKITATDDGTLVLGVYKPGDNRSVVCFSLSKSKPMAYLSSTRPPSQAKPNSFVQIARKHLTGQIVTHAYVTLDPCTLVLEFTRRDKATQTHGADESQTGGEELASVLIFDTESKPPRLCLCIRHDQVPKRYQSESTRPNHPAFSARSHSFQETAQADVHAANRINGMFLESLCEWSLEQTKTKRRATFSMLTHSPLAFCPMAANMAEQLSCADSPAAPNHRLPAKLHSPTNTADRATATENLLEIPLLPDANTTQKPNVDMAQALAVFPTHVRRAIKTKMQFFERRLLKQKQDLPSVAELEIMEKRAEGLRANLYLWPLGSNIWYVPRELIESCGLPALLRLKSGDRPGDLLSQYFTEIDKLKRRRTELQLRLQESQKSLDNFAKLVLDAANETIAQNNETLASPATLTPAVLRLLEQLEVAWSLTQQKQKFLDEEKSRKLPFRSFRAITGEFIRVAKSASEADAMLRLMPSHHFWLHVMTGEGSHVWLEKPKKAKPSTQAVRAAGILALHYSKHSRAMQGDIYVTTRGDIEKKKDLAPGKVIVRKAESLLLRYQAEELQEVLDRHE